MKEITRVAGIIIKDGKLLMLLGHGYTRLWTPGGKMDANETDEECLRRELKEEIGVDLVEAQFFKEYPSPSFYHEGDTTINRIYLAKISGTPLPAAEIREVVWLTKEDYENKKYLMIPVNQEEIIPDLIKEGIW